MIDELATTFELLAVALIRLPTKSASPQMRANWKRSGSPACAPASTSAAVEADSFGLERSDAPTSTLTRPPRGRAREALPVLSNCARTWAPRAPPRAVRGVAHGRGPRRRRHGADEAGRGAGRRPRPYPAPPRGVPRLSTAPRSEPRLIATYRERGWSLHWLTSMVKEARGLSEPTEPTRRSTDEALTSAEMRSSVWSDLRA